MPSLSSNSIAAGHDRIILSDRASAQIWVDAARMHGEPCFKGTRVPVQILFDHLRCGDPLEEFLEGFPDVSREQAVAVIDLAADSLLGGLHNL